MATLGIDFGTSNTAAGIAIGGTPRLISLEAEAQTLPTAVFFDFEAREMRIGAAASDALLAGAEGRYMRGLKSLLGTRLMRERRVLLGERLDFIDIVARFLAPPQECTSTGRSRGAPCAFIPPMTPAMPKP